MATIPRSIGLIGYGAIGKVVADALVHGRAGRARLCAVLCRDPAKHRAIPGVLFTAERDAFLGAGAELVVEAAGQDALRALAGPVLAAGRDLLVTSIGAFTDDDFFAETLAQAEHGGARLLLASGALPAVDWMASAARAGECNASITQAKPVASWRGTPAESLVDLDALREATCFFEGTARESGRRFPKSSNITAMLALSTAGLDRTRVRLVADPTTTEMFTRIDFSSAAGSLQVEWRGVPSLENPRTSADVPLNVVKAIANLTATLGYGP